MTTTQMLAVIGASLCAVALAVVAWMKVHGRMPGVDVWLLRRRIARAERLCQADVLWRVVCAHWAGQDVYAEDVRPPEVES